MQFGIWSANISSKITFNDYTASVQRSDVAHLAQTNEQQRISPHTKVEKSKGY